MLQIQLKLFDPDTWMDRAMPWIRWWWSPWCVVPAVLVFFVVLGFLFANWDLYWAGFFRLLDPTRNTPWDWVGLFGLVFSVSIWHELGHGFTCKRFGGEVHDIGFMIFYFEPAFYCNIDDSYLFPKVSERIWCAFGGPYFELGLCSIAVGTWLLTPAEWWVHTLAASLVFITGLSALINLNPLIKLDGYYALMDWLDVPELREESFAFVGGWIKKHLFRLPVTETPISRRRRRIYLLYGVFSVLYTGLVFLVIYLMFRGWLVAWFGPLGYLLLFALLAYLLRRKLTSGVRFLRHVWLDKRDAWRSRGGRLGTGIAVVALAVLVTVPRCATRIGSTFVVEPGQRAVIRAPSGGVVRETHVEEGTPVVVGQTLAVLANRDLEAAWKRTVTDRERGRRYATRARVSGDVATAGVWEQREHEAVGREEILRREMDEFVLHAPIAGVVTTPDLDRMRGRYLREGDPVCTVDRLDTVRLAISSLESDVAEISPGSEVRMLVRALAGETLRGTVRSVAPVAHDPTPTEEQALDLVQRVQLVRVLVEVENPGHHLRPGMSGRVQILGRLRSAAGRVWWRARRWATSVFW
jgi:putative peptide zinc metalloprotease protein